MKSHFESLAEALFRLGVTNRLWNLLTENRDKTTFRTLQFLLDQEKRLTLSDSDMIIIRTMTEEAQKISGLLTQLCHLFDPDLTELVTKYHIHARVMASALAFGYHEDILFERFSEFVFPNELVPALEKLSEKLKTNSCFG